MIFDIIIIVLVVIGIINGLVKGLVSQALGLIGLVLSFLIAKIFSMDLSNYILKWVHWSEEIRYVAAWIGIFIIIGLITSLLSFLITKAVHAIQLGCINRCLGAAFGAAKLLFISSLLLNLYSIGNTFIPMPFNEDIPKSKLYGITLDFAPILYNKGKEVIENELNESIKTDKNQKSATKEI